MKGPQEKDFRNMGEGFWGKRGNAEKRGGGGGGKKINELARERGGMDRT